MVVFEGLTDGLSGHKSLSNLNSSIINVEVTVDK